MKNPEIKISLIQKMLSRRIIGAHHIRWETLMKCGWKPHEKGFVKEAIEECLKEGIILWAKKSHKALVLNLEKIQEIKLKYTEGG